MTTLRKSARRRLNAVLGLAGFQLRRVGEPSHIISYQPFTRTLKAAQKAGRSVGDYLDSQHQVPGATQATVDQLASIGVLGQGVNAICELGPGSGRYLEKVQRLCRPSSYEIYETDRDWASWLVKTYSVTTRAANGTDLHETPSDSVDLVHAHKVLVYLPFVVTWIYLTEMIRVARPRGWIVFDLVSEDCMPEPIIEKWAANHIYYPCMTPRQLVLDLFNRRQCSLKASFFAPMMPGKSEYFVFVKERSLV